MLTVPRKRRLLPYYHALYHKKRPLSRVLAKNSKQATTNFYLNNLPEDYIPYWDLIFKDGNSGVDEMNIWGCYFFMEALHRMLDPEWKLYW